MKTDFVNWDLSLLSIDKIWEYTKGEDIKIAILDTGIDLSHPDLKTGIKDTYDFTGGGSVADIYGHGTHIAGIIGARSTGSGVIGIAPESELLIAKISDNENFKSLTQITKAVNWAIENNARIINLSLETNVNNNSLHNALKVAVEKNIFVIASTGNNKYTVKFPACYDEVIGVGSVDYDGKSYIVSQYSGRGKEISVVAPGECIQSCWIDKGYKKESGTSMAAAFVSGCVALMLSYQKKNPLSNEIGNQKALKKLIEQTSIDLGPTGFDYAYGYGMINPTGLVLRT
ncbi:MAG: S8 family serine peptidase [Candidatus Aminicenantes bacterium]|nr:S8 family serine peptidase [Candidatus Aminicenantes bacterium]